MSLSLDESEAETVRSCSSVILILGVESLSLVVEEEDPTPEEEEEPCSSVGARAAVRDEARF